MFSVLAAPQPHQAAVPATISGIHAKLEQSRPDRWISSILSTITVHRMQLICIGHLTVNLVFWLDSCLLLFPQ